jgi:hypothetical protein
MIELRIEEQKSILGGTTWEFKDKTTGYGYTDTDGNRIKSTYYHLKAEGHDLTPLRRYNI